MQKLINLRICDINLVGQAIVIITRKGNRVKRNTQAYSTGDIIAYDFNDRASEMNLIVDEIKQLFSAENIKDSKKYGLNYNDIVILVSQVKKIPELIQVLQLSQTHQQSKISSYLGSFAPAI